MATSFPLTKHENQTYMPNLSLKRLKIDLTPSQLISYIKFLVA